MANDVVVPARSTGVVVAAAVLASIGLAIGSPLWFYFGLAFWAAVALALRWRRPSTQADHRG